MFWHYIAPIHDGESREIRRQSNSHGVITKTEQLRYDKTQNLRPVIFYTLFVPLS